MQVGNINPEKLKFVEKKEKIKKGKIMDLSFDFSGELTYQAQIGEKYVSKNQDILEGESQNELKDSYASLDLHNKEEFPYAVESEIASSKSTVEAQEEENNSSSDTETDSSEEEKNTIEPMDGMKYREASNWNGRWQEIMNMLDEDQKGMLMAEIIKDFHYNARKYGEIIISEKYLPLDKKTIKPVSIGGVAGGQVKIFSLHFE